MQRLNMVEDETTGLINPAGVGKDLASLLKYRKTKFQTLIDQWDKKCDKCKWPENTEDAEFRKMPKPI